MGQHLITGKEAPKLSSPIDQLFLTDDETAPVPASVAIRDKMTRLISRADLICYPMGSFYSSIIANILPRGIGTAINRAACPKIFIPNTTTDPEALGCDVADQVERLLHYLKKDNPSGINTESVLNFVFVDKDNGAYPYKINEKKIKKLGVRVIDYPLVTPRSSPMIDAQRLVELLLSLN